MVARYRAYHLPPTELSTVPGRYRCDLRSCQGIKSSRTASSATPLALRTMLNHLADVELALNALRAETRRLAIRQLEEQAVNLEVMKTSGSFGLQDWRDALKETVFTAVSAIASLSRSLS